MPFIHGGFRFTPISVEDDRATGFYVQKIFGLRVPLLVSFAHPSPSSRLYETALGPLALVIEATLAPLGEGTRVTTSYAVGAPSWLRALLPLAERFLRRNYARLHAEDEPMRARRRELRAWGYRFAADARAASYRRSLDLSLRNTIAGEAREGERLLDLDDGEREWLIGRADHLGLRVVRSGSTVRVLPRMCTHEGANLDGCEESAGTVQCPWHGRVVSPLCSFELGVNHDVRTANHDFHLTGHTLRVHWGPAS